MFKNEDVAIMKGEHDDLVAVTHFLRLMGVASSTKRARAGLYNFSYVLQVDRKQETSARKLANEYVASCNKMRVIELKVQEIFEQPREIEESEIV